MREARREARFYSGGVGVPLQPVGRAAAAAPAQVGRRDLADSPRDRRSAPRARTRRSPARSRSRPPAAPRARSARPAGSTRPVAFSAETMLKISRTISGASPSDGSSSISSRGLLISARPSASICRSPPDSVPASCVAPLVQARKARVDIVAACARSSRSPRRTRANAPSSRLSATVIDAEELALLGHQHEAARRRAARRSARSTASPAVADVAARRQRAHDRGEQRRLARAVGADHGDDAALRRP